jgi:hypothetical protein
MGRIDRMTQGNEGNATADERRSGGTARREASGIRVHLRLLSAVTLNAGVVPGGQDERKMLPAVHPEHHVHPCSVSGEFR